MAKRIQYQGLSVVPPTSGTHSWLEVVSVDRFQPIVPTPPQSNWQKALLYSVAAIAPFLFFVAPPTGQSSFPESVTADRWHPAIEQPIAKIRPIDQRQYTYPNFFFTENSFAETVSVDRWQGSKPDIIWDLERTQYTYPSFFHDPIPITIISPILASDVAITYPRTTQYQSHFKPVLPPSEVITLDKWIGQKPDFGGRLQNFTYTYPYFSIDTKQLAQPERTTPDKWLGYHPNIIFDLKRQQFTYPSEFRTDILTPVSEPINSDSYHPDIIFDLKRQQYTYPTLFFTENSFAETVSVDRWQGSKPDIIWDLKKTQFDYPNSFFTELSAKTITVDQWLTPTEQPVKTTPITVHLQQSLIFTSIPITIITPIGNENNVNIVYPRVTQYQGSFNPVLPPAEVITVDKWSGHKPDIIWDLKRLQFTYPNFFFTEIFFPETVLIDKTPPQYPDFIFDLKRQQFTYPSEFRTDILTPVSEPINSDSYHPDIIFDLKRQQYTYPSEFRIDLFPPSAEVINAFSYHPDIIFDLRRQQYTYPFFVIDPTLTLERVSIDKWQPQIPDLIFDLKRQQFIYPHFFFTERSFLETIFIDKWYGSKPDIIWDLKRLQYLYPSWMPIDPLQLTKKENITVDKWFKETEKPVWDIQRLQYMYPSWSPIDPLAMLQKGQKATPKLILVDGELALLLLDPSTGFKYYTLLTGLDIS